MSALRRTIICGVVGGLVFALVYCSHRYREQNKSLFDDEPAAEGILNDDSKLASQAHGSLLTYLSRPCPQQPHGEHPVSP
jgi:hypothetical protein